MSWLTRKWSLFANTTELCKNFIPFGLGFTDETQAPFLMNCSVFWQIWRDAHRASPVGQQNFMGVWTIAGGARRKPEVSLLCKLNWTLNIKMCMGTAFTLFDWIVECAIFNHLSSTDLSFLAKKKTVFHKNQGLTNVKDQKSSHLANSPSFAAEQSWWWIDFLWQEWKKHCSLRKSFSAT